MNQALTPVKYLKIATLAKTEPEKVAGFFLIEVTASIDTTRSALLDVTIAWDTADVAKSATTTQVIYNVMN